MANEKKEFRGYISDFGEGVILDQDKEITDKVNLIHSNAYNQMDTYGLGNLDFEGHKEKIDLTSKPIYNEPKNKKDKTKPKPKLKLDVDGEPIKLKNADGTEIKDIFDNNVYEIERENMVKPISINEVEGSGKTKYLIEFEDGTSATKGEVIEAIKSKARTLRAPKFLALDHLISAEDAQKILVASNNTIVDNNQLRKRADTLNIITVPKEEWTRLALIGELEKKVFENIKNVPTDETKLDANISEAVKEILNYKEQYPILKAKYEVALENASPKAPELKKAFDKLVKEHPEKLKELGLPTNLIVTHPYEKYEEENKDEKKSKRDNNEKIIPKYKSVSVVDIEYDVLNDEVHGKDNGKIFIKGANAIIPINTKENTLLTRINDIEKQQEIKLKRSNIHVYNLLPNQKIMDLSKPIDFVDTNVLTSLLDFQPSQTDHRTPNYSSIQRGGTSTTRLGIENADQPALVGGLEDIFNPKDEDPILKNWLKNPRNKKKLANYYKQLTDFQNSYKRTPPIRCQTGSIPILRKWSPDAWGMTPKQKICTSTFAKERYNQLQNKMQELHISKEKAEAILNENPNYKKYVGCNSNEEIKIAETNEQNYRTKMNAEEGEEGMEESEIQGEEQEPFKVPMRFPTKNAIGDTMYCKSYKNAKPNVNYFLTEGDLKRAIAKSNGSSINSDKKSQSKLLDAMGIKPTETLNETEEKFETPRIGIHNNSERKKSVVLLRQDANDFPLNE